MRFGGGHVERKFFPRLESRVMFIYEYTVPCILFVSNPTEMEIMWTKSPTTSKCIDPFFKGGKSLLVLFCQFSYDIYPVLAVIYG